MLSRLSNFEVGLFDQFRLLEQEMEQMLDRVSGNRTSTGYPPVNLSVKKDQVDVYLYIPGVDKDRLNMTLHKNLLTLKGSREARQDEGVNYHQRERFDGEFNRAVSLPEDVDPEKVEATYDNGVLHITIQRRESSAPRQIEVKTTREA